METITANLSGGVRRDKLGGRDYLVAPLVMVSSGTLNGSQGALYYPPEELRRSTDQWNDIPMVVYHPRENGAPVSGRSPAVLDKQKVGRVYNAHFDDQDRLVAEGWFEVEAVRRVDSGILRSLEAGKKVELSTGLYTTNTPAPPGSVDKRGRPYEFIAKNYFADHLAILPQGRGACAISDGCGVLVNEDPDMNKPSIWAKLGEALGVTTDRAPVGPPVEAVTNETKDGQIGTSPTSGGPKLATVNLSADQRRQIITALVANCDCPQGAPWKGKDEVALNSLSDDALHAFDECRKAMLATTNAAQPAPLPGFVDPHGNRHVFDHKTNQWTSYPSFGQQPAPVANVQPPPSVNAAFPITAPGLQTPPAPRGKTVEEWIGEKFPGLSMVQVENAIQSAVEVERRERDALIEQLTANVAGETKASVQQIYGAMKVEQLRQLAAAQPAREQHQQTQQVANYAGAAGAYVPQYHQEEPLLAPVYNFNRN